MPEDKIRDIIIIGAGPAGVSAAVYAARGEMDLLLMDSNIVGGQLNWYQDIENYPGFASVKTYELIQKYEEQLEYNNVEKALLKEITEVQTKGDIKVIKTTDGEYKAKTIIICTGTNPRKLGVPGEQEYTGRGVSYCAVCDGMFYKGKDIAIVGGGNSAIEEGLYLTRFVNSVTFIHRRDCLRASKLLQKRALEHPKTSFLWNHTVEEVQGDDQHVRNLVVKNTQTGQISDFKTDGVFPYIGLIPNTKLFEGKLEMDDIGNLICDSYLRTSEPGIFAAGDVRETPIRQIVVAASDGAIAATSAIRYIDEGGHIVTSEAEEAALADRC